jgi:hypothetical protein
VLDDALLAAAQQLAATLLQVHTGKFEASIKGRVRDNVDSIIGRVYSGAQQAAILEYGGDIPAHEIEPKNARALHFAAFMAGDVFAARVHFPGATIKPHPVITGALDDMNAEIVEGLTAAVTGKFDALL